jgi:hypothetical protein
MTEYIGDVAIPSFQEVSFGTSQNQDEIDLIEENSNVLLTSEDEGEEITIAFTLVQNPHPEKADVETQREDVKSLVANDASDNYLEFDGYEVFISIEDISIPQSGDRVNIYSGEISGTAYPYPKHFDDSRTGNNKVIAGGLDYPLFIKGDINSYPYLNLNNLDYSFDVTAKRNLLYSVDGSIDLSFDLVAERNILRSSEGTLDYTIDMDDVIADMLHSSVGFVQVSVGIQGSINLEDSVSGSINSSFDLSAEFDENVGGGFGREFGRQFGGLLEKWEYSYGNYGAGSYGGEFEEGDYGHNNYDNGIYGS